jgi:hypothetical protein
MLDNPDLTDRELTLSHIHQPKETHKRGHYLALTFGTLLSSQGADALVPRPFRPSFEAISRLYTALRSSQTSGVCPAVDQAGGPVRSRSVQREQYTTRGALCRGATEGSVPTLDALVTRASASAEAGWGPDPCGHRVQRRPSRRASHRCRALRHRTSDGEAWGGLATRCRCPRRAPPSASRGIGAARHGAGGWEPDR